MSQIQNEEQREIEEDHAGAEVAQNEENNKEIVNQQAEHQKNYANQQIQQQQHQKVQEEAQEEESLVQIHETNGNKAVQSEKNKENKGEEKYVHKEQVNEAENQQTQHKQQIEQGKQQTNQVEAPVVQKSQAKKVQKSKTIQKSKSHHTENLSFDQLLKQILEENKLVRVIFHHFCKENNLMCIKSTLFQQKQRKLQEMSLNKWMVFCKQFQIYSKLCTIKNSARQAKVASNQLPLQTSQVRQLHRVKQAKQVQKTLMEIFKHSNKNASKIKFQSFVIAIASIFYQFKQLYSQNQKGINQFLSQVIYCSDEKTCYKKLSHLKFTTATPQIEYNKINFSDGQLRAKVKAVLSKTKQNYESRMHILSSKEKKQTLSRNFTKLNLNPVLIEAKRSLNEFNSYSKRGHNNQLNLAKLTIKLHPPKQNEHQMQLIDYFQTTKDPILDSYFMLESGKKMSEIKP